MNIKLDKITTVELASYLTGLGHGVHTTCEEDLLENQTPKSEMLRKPNGRS
jgi:hypothetical protein